MSIRVDPWLNNLKRNEESNKEEQNMAKVIITATVNDPQGWEGKFRSQGKLFKEYTARTVSYSVNERGEVAALFECDDLVKCLEMIKSPATAEAMESDGVDRSTVNLYVLDNEFTP